MLSFRYKSETFQGKTAHTYRAIYTFLKGHGCFFCKSYILQMVKKAEYIFFLSSIIDNNINGCFQIIILWTYEPIRSVSWVIWLFIFTKCACSLKFQSIHGPIGSLASIGVIIWLSNSSGLLKKIMICQTSWILPVNLGGYNIKYHLTFCRTSAGGSLLGSSNKMRSSINLSPPWDDI